MATKFTVWSLDVWGHVEADPKDCDCERECPGYIVNDRCKVGTVEIGDQDPVIKTLVEGGFLTDDCDDKSIDVDGDPDFMIEINRKSDGKYLLQLEPEHDQ
jgi:hypothetical protein